MRGIVALLLIVALANAVIDQSFVQTVSRDGGSSMEKTMELAMFSGTLGGAAIQKMAEYCDGAEMDCSVDTKRQEITIWEKLAPGTYYTYSVDNGLPYITYTLTVTRLPNDLFAADLQDVLAGAGAAEGGAAAVDALDFADTATNSRSIPILKLLDANLTYAASMPGQVTYAMAGGVEGAASGSSASFDIVKVMEAGKPIVIRSQELNSPYVFGIGAMIAILILGYAFTTTKPKATAKKKK